MKENRTDSASNSQSSTPATGKQVPTSRLGRGLGSLIPAAPQQPFQPVALPPTKPESDKSPSTASAQVKMPIALNVPLAIQSPLTNPTIQSIERSTGNIPVASPAIPTTAVVEMNISFIARNSRQPREKFDDRAIQSLAESIRQHGLLQPVVIRKLRIPHGGKTHELIAGERRLRAFESLGRTAIPSITREADEAQSAVFALIENVQREDLNPLERSKALQRLITEFSWTQQQAAEKVGLDRATVANLLRLNDLDPFSAGCVREGRLSQGHAKALLAIDNLPARRVIAEKALHDEWSVRQIEREVQRIKAASGLTSAQAPPPPRRGSAQVGDLERRVGLHIGSKVKIKKGRKAGTGSLTIQFFTLDQFDGILQKMGFDPNNLNY
ncbi:MAG: ParB/RepB/Spo0J family partition protein [Planctomycetota bacterium]|nr:ParB/RepB/Spo0J family partition protein [Planctomycetota bacterium]